MGQGPAADERLGDFVHADRGQEPGRAPFVLESVLQGQAVDHGRGHAHVMGGRFLDHVRPAGELRSAKDVAAPHDDRELNPACRDSRGLPGDPADFFNTDAPLAGPAKTLTGELEQHAAEDWLAGGRTGGP